MYYRDPDNNQVELVIDNFDDVRDGRASMQSPDFAKTPIGLPPVRTRVVCYAPSGQGQC